jgi:hypothetical protein
MFMNKIDPSPTFVDGIDLKFLIETIFSWPSALIFVCITVFFTLYFISKNIKYSHGINIEFPGGFKLHVPRKSESNIALKELENAPPPFEFEHSNATTDRPPADDSEEGSDHERFFNLVDDRDVAGLNEFFDGLEKRGIVEFLGYKIDLSRTAWLSLVGDEKALDLTFSLDPKNEEDRTVLAVAAREMDRRGDEPNSKRLLEKLKGYPEEHEIRAGMLWSKDGDDAALKYLDIHIDNSKDSAQLLRLAAEICGDKYKIRQSSYLYKLIWVAPKDESSRFQLAYISEEKIESAFHYKFLLRDNPRHSTARNNLSMIYDAFGLPTYAVQMLQTAAKSGDDYPVGNLAIRLADAGFIELAEKQLLNEKGLQRLERRTSEAISHIAELKHSQSKRFDSLDDTTKLFGTLSH